MTKAEKKVIITKKQQHPQDTGSDQVQVALLNQEIANLSHHLKANPKDIVCRRILLKKVAKWKKFKHRLPASQ